MRKMRWQKGWRALTLVLLVTMLAACAKGGSGTPGEPGKTVEKAKGGRLVLARTASSDTLDPAHTIVAASSQVFSYIFDTLIVRTAEGFGGQIAEKWETSADAKEWTFHLRKELLFSNGNPVNADAVVATFQRILDPATKAPSRGFIGTLERVEKVDEQTVKFILAKPSALLLENLSISYFGIVDPKAVQQYGDTFGRNPVGSGPFKLKEWVTGDRIVLEANEHYKSFAPYTENKGKPYLSELVFRDIPQIETQIAAVRSGEANFMLLPGDKAAQFAQQPDFKILKVPGGTGISYLHFGMDKAAAGMNTFRAPFDDIRVRQAVGYAVDAQAIIDHVLYGTAERNPTPMPTGNFGHDPELKRYGYTFDPAKAKQLLDDAGWKVGANGVREKNGKKLSVKYWAAAGAPEIAPVLQSQLSQVGIQTELTILDGTTLLGRIGASDFELHTLTVNWPAPNILQIASNIGWGFGLYNDPQLAESLAKAEITVDAAARKQLYVQAQQRILEQAAMVPLLTATGLLLVRSEVEGVKFDPAGAVIIQDVYIKQ
jgi:peptide/nickel transport system substrate-binding protein